MSNDNADKQVDSFGSGISVEATAQPEQNATPSGSEGASTGIQSARHELVRMRAFGLKHGTVTGLVILLSALCAFFFRSLFQGKCIAKLDILNTIDAFYNHALKSAIVPIPCDPSGALIFYPLGHFAASCWSKFVLPLWNPRLGCGYPMVGDPQSFIFSPAHLLGIFSNPTLYNLGLLLEIFLGATGAYFFARFVRLSVPGSLFAALAFSLCPRNLSQVDLSGAECFFPWIFLLFGRLAAKPLNPGRIVACAILTAAAAYGSHPETALFAAGYGAIYAASAILFGDASGAVTTNDTHAASAQSEEEVEDKQLRRRLADVCKSLSPVALISVLLSLPLLLPFVEFIGNAFFYKSDAAPSFIKPEQFFWSLYCAREPESYFLGAICALLLPAGLFGQNIFSKRKRVSDGSLVPPSIILTLFICAFLTIPPAFMIPLLSLKPLSFVATLYGAPELLLLMSVVAGFGMDFCLHNRLRKTQVFILSFSLLIVILAPVALGFELARTDIAELIQKSIFDQRQLLQATVWVALPAYLLIMVRPFIPIVPSIVLSVFLLVLNFVSLGLISRSALPVRKAFNPPAASILKKVDSDQGRIVSTGANFFLPNATSVRGVNDLRTFCPLIGDRYHEFLIATGAVCHNLYFYDYPDSLSNLLDLASVRYVLTRSAVIGSTERSAANKIGLQLSLSSSFAKTVDKQSLRQTNSVNSESIRSASAKRDRALLSSRGNATIRLAGGVRLHNAEFTLDTANSQIDGALYLVAQGNAANRYAMQFVLIDLPGSKEIWSSPAQLLEGDSFAINGIEVPLHIPVPLSARRGQRLALGLRLTDSWTGASLADKESDTLARNIVGDVIVLCSFSNSSARQLPGNVSAERHFKVISEQDGMRLYENTRAFPPAYTMDLNKVLLTRSEEESLELFSKPTDFRKHVFIEVPLTDQLPKPLAGRGSTNSYPVALGDLVESAIEPAVIQRIDCNNVVVKANCKTAAVLVLTDYFYPGWTCKVDDREQPIYVANYLFRGVLLQKGPHEVKFSYRPLSFGLGLSISLSTLALLVVLFAFRHKSRRMRG